MQLRTLRNIITGSAVAFGLIAFSQPALAETSSISLTPDTATVVAGSTVQFTVTARATDGTSSDVTSAAAFTTTDPRGTLSTTGLFTAGKTGQWRVTASYQGKISESTIKVTAAPLVDMTINPNTDPEVIVIGAKRTFTATGYDRLDNKISSLNVSWSVDGDMGTISDSGVFTAKKLGTGSIIARSGDVQRLVAVKVVTAPIVNTTIQPTNTNKAANTNTTNVNSNENANANQNTNSSTTTDADQANNWWWIVIGAVIIGGGYLIYRNRKIS